MEKNTNFRFFSILFFVTLLLCGCSNEQSNKTVRKSLYEFNAKVINRPDSSDLDIIRQKKQLRILVSKFNEPQQVINSEHKISDHGVNLAIQFALENQLEPVIVYTKKKLLIPALLKGYGDIIASHLIVNDEQTSNIAYTHPLRFTQQQLLQPIKKISPTPQAYHFQMKDLNNMKIGVQKSEIYWETVKHLKQKHPDLTSVIIAEEKSTKDIIKQMLDGQYDATFSDTVKMENALAFQDKVSIAYTLKEKNALAWGVRPKNPLLLDAVNFFIENYRMSNDYSEMSIVDFPGMKNNAQIRLITRNNATSYFLWKNKLMGFEYELIKKFAKEHHLKLKVLVADDFNQMIQWLREGKGDIVSASLTINPEREKLGLFSKPYNFTQQVILQRSDEHPIELLPELLSRTIAIRKTSDYLNTLEELKTKTGMSFNIQEVDEELETQNIIDAVANNAFDLTIVDQHIFAMENAWRNDVQISLKLKENISHHWLVRETNPILQQKLDQFIDKIYRGTFYNVTYNKYFNNSRQIFSQQQLELSNEQISKYDELVKHYSKKYKFNWLLISAQINQESHFDPLAKSWVGAKGLMQMMPRTAQKLQVSNLEIPKNSISSGLKYMSWIREQFDGAISIEDKNWLTLAAYNAGIGHVQDARKLAKKMGLDPMRWFGHTEKAMLLLSQRKYARQARYGYVRGSEPVYYVKQIRQIYQLYQKKYSEHNNTRPDILIKETSEGSK